MNINFKKISFINIVIIASYEIFIKVRTQRFFEKFQKKFFFWYSYSFWKDVSTENLIVLKFLSEVPTKFKENAVICLITVKKCVIFYSFSYKFPNNTCGISSKMNEHRLFFHFVGNNLFFSKIYVVLQGNSS